MLRSGVVPCRPMAEGVLGRQAGLLSSFLPSSTPQLDDEEEPGTGTEKGDNKKLQ